MNEIFIGLAFYVGFALGSWFGVWKGMIFAEKLLKPPAPAGKEK